MSAAERGPIATIHVNGSFVHVEWHTPDVPSVCHLKVYDKPPVPDVMSPQEEFEWDFLARTRGAPDDSREVRRVLRALYISKFLTADEYVAAVDALKVAP